MKRFLMLCVAAFTLVACGGSGSSSAPNADPVPSPNNLTLERPPVSSLPANLLPPG